MNWFGGLVVGLVISFIFACGIAIFTGLVVRIIYGISTEG